MKPTRPLLVVITTAAASLALTACGTTPAPAPMTTEKLVQLFKDKGAVSAECRPGAEGKPDQQLCRLALADGTARVLIVTGDSENWTTEPCLATNGCEGWK